METTKECPRETAREQAITLQEALYPGTVDMQRELAQRIVCDPALCRGPVQVPRKVLGLELTVLPKTVCGLDAARDTAATNGS